MTVTSTELGDDTNNVLHDQVPAAEPLRRPSTAQAGTSTQVLITEQQVLLGSAAANSAPLPLRRRANPLLAVVRGLHRVVTWEPGGTEDRHQKHATKTPDWYSDALMAREMRHL
ncbi:hypothetical protein BH10ACT9_BH10ACT9_53280 [soil metagenome]